MNRQPTALIGALVIALLASNASGQLAGGWSSGGTVSAVTTPGGAPGGFLGGSDDCSAAHTNLGSGDVFLVPFATGSTGSEGQNEPFCNSGMQATGIDNDVWFDWTATQTGLATVTTCAGTTADTKIAIWPENSPAGCPADGTALICHDNRPACGFQAITTWPVTAGSTYTIQLGNAPGAAPGSGTIDVVQSLPPPCGQYDDGMANGYAGANGGGDIGWIHGQDCLGWVDRIETAFGVLGNPNPISNGLPARVVCYENPDCDGLPSTPVGGMTL